MCRITRVEDDFMQRQKIAVICGQTFTLFLLLVLAACGDANIRKRVQDVDYAIDAYAYALRWARIADAIAYHMDRDGNKPEIDLSMMDRIRVTGFAIREKILDEEISEVRVRGELSYYDTGYGTLKKMDFSQSWWYEPESKKWYLESAFPEFE